MRSSSWTYAIEVPCRREQIEKIDYVMCDFWPEGEIMPYNFRRGKAIKNILSGVPRTGVPSGFYKTKLRLRERISRD